MAGKKYIVKLDGVVIGKRASARIYSHAVAVVYDLAADRAEVARPAAEYGCKSHRSDFDYYVELAARGAADNVPHTIAQAKIAGGYAGYLAAIRERSLAHFDARHGGAAESVYIAGWCGRLDLAQKLAASEQGRQYVKRVMILPAEEAPAKAAKGAV